MIERVHHRRVADERSTEWMDNGRIVTIEIRRSKVEALIARDRPYEPPPPQPAAFWKAGAPAAQTAYASSGTGRWPEGTKTVVAMGLVIPGGAQMWAHDYVSPDAADRLMLRGAATMAGVLALAAVGANSMPDGNQRSDGTATHAPSKNNRSVAYGFFAAAAALHLWGVYDAVHVLDRSRTTFAVVPERGGASMYLSGRF